MGEKKQSVRLKAQDYFVENLNATQAEVAELYNVTAKTISEWARKYDWEQKRLDYHASPVKIKELLQRELLSVAQGNPAKLPADGISKLMAALDRCDKKADPIVVSRVLKDLLNFIAEVEPEYSLKCIPFFKKFLQHRVNLEIQ